MLLLSSLILIAFMLVAGWAVTRGDMEKSEGGKLGYLEGIRGLAAFSVVICHFLQIYFPAAVAGITPLSHFPYESVLPLTPIFLFYSGGYAVALFFVLSGFVLSYAYFKRHDKAILISGAFRRYFRLLGPVLFAHLVGLLMHGWYKAEFLQMIEGNPILAFEANRVDPTLLGTLKDAFFNVFIKSMALEELMNPALWTMKLEFLGSLLIFGFLFFFGKSWLRYPLAIALMILIPRQFVWAFLTGMILCELYLNGKLAALNQKPVKIGLALLAVYGGSFPLYLDIAYVPNTLYAWIKPIATSAEWHTLGWGILTIGAIASLLFVLLDDWSKQFFARPIFLFLGKISFALYVLHCYFLVHLMPPMVLSLSGTFGHIASSLIAFVLIMPLMIGVSYVTYLYIDRGTVKVSRQLYQTVEKSCLGVMAVLKPRLQQALASRQIKEPTVLPES